MKQTRYIRIVRIGTGIGIIIPTAVVRDLKLKRGDYLDLAIVDEVTIIARRLKVVDHNNVEEREDSSLPKIPHE